MTHTDIHTLTGETYTVHTYEQRCRHDASFLPNELPRAGMLKNWLEASSVQANSSSKRLKAEYNVRKQR